jgi:hypothetical protein
MYVYLLLLHHLFQYRTKLKLYCAILSSKIVSDASHRTAFTLLSRPAKSIFDETSSLDIILSFCDIYVLPLQSISSRL